LAEAQEYLKVEDVVETFQGDLKAGVLDPEYRADAKRAGVRRARGDFIRKEEVEESEESEEESSEDESELEDERVDSEDSEVKGKGKVPGKVKITIHED
jgi:hypothetical protein